jgi:hypothetical protein
VAEVLGAGQAAGAVAVAVMAVAEVAGTGTAAVVPRDVSLPISSAGAKLNRAGQGGASPPPARLAKGGAFGVRPKRRFRLWNGSRRDEAPWREVSSHRKPWPA